MKKIALILLTIATLAVTAQEFTKSIPDWYNKPPKSDKKYFGAGVGTSKAIDIAESKALLDAKTAIAEQVGKVKYTNKKIKKKLCINRNEEETVHSKQIEAELSDVRLIKKTVMQDGENYTVYVLCEMKKNK